MYAPENPRTPINAIARWSAPDIGPGGCRLAKSSKASHAMASRENASVAGGTLSKVTRATTYEVPYTTFATSITTSPATEDDRAATLTPRRPPRETAHRTG